MTNKWKKYFKLSCFFILINGGNVVYKIILGKTNAIMIFVVNLIIWIALTYFCYKKMKKENR